MTKYVIDAPAQLHLAREGIEVSAEHELLAPTLIRSQTLSLMHEAVQAGQVPAAEARDVLAAVGRMKVRLLGDAVLRRVAWKYADQLGLASTYDAEYLALTDLQGDALVALGADLACIAEGVVPTASIDDLGRRST